MTKAELFEEIRVRLREPQVSSEEDPFLYTDDELVIHVRSALRWARVNRTISTDAEMAPDGTLLPEPSEEVGVLVALRVASQLLRSDMINRLNSGQMGIYFRAGDNIVDTKTVATNFKAAAQLYDAELESLVNVLLCDPTRSAGSFFGGSTPSFEQ
jgi:hypothetical protein